MSTTLTAAADTLAAAAASNASLGTIGVATALMIGCAITAWQASKFAVKAVALILFGLIFAGTTMGADIKAITGELTGKTVTTVDDVTNK